MNLFRPYAAGLLLALSFYAQWGNAQQPLQQFEAGFYAGSAVRNYPDFPELSGPATLGYLKYGRQLNGDKPWHRYYKYPFMGFHVTAGTLGNNAVLGKMAGATFEIRLPAQLGKKFTYSTNLGIGASWFSDPYDETSNPENFLIGSPVTFFASAAAELSYHLNTQFDLVLKGILMHSSNAHYQLPNVGLNLPAAGIGVRYNIGNREQQPIQHDSVPYDKKPRLNVRLALGFNEQGDSQGPVNGPKYPIYLGSVFASFKASPVNKLKAGVETWYNSGVYDFIVSQEFYEEKETKRSFAVALMFGHEFLLGHWGVVTDAGLYLYNPFYQDRFEQVEDQSFREELKTYVPARIGFQYYLKDITQHHRKNLFVGIYIKSNVGQADFLESGLGYTF
jgi:hypothetical protein